MAEFPWKSGAPEESHGYLLPAVLAVLSSRLATPGAARLLDVGSGNGAMTAEIAKAGYGVLGLEPSEGGVRQARTHFPNLKFEHGSGYEDLAERFGHFDAIVSCEVVEHLLTPTLFMRRLGEVLKPAGFIVVSTPYHGYLKNVLVALAGKWDHHHHPEREWGHVKFFSRETLNKVAVEAGLKEVEFTRVGRLPPIAKSMISVYEST